MRVQVNGEEQDLPAGISLQDLIGTLRLAQERIAVELNGSVQTRSRWSSTELKDDDRIEIVHFVGGGYGWQRQIRLDWLARCKVE